MSFISKVIFCIILVLLSQQTINAQTKYGNEWINPSKKYLKLKVAENGLYRVTYEELLEKGFISGNINGASLQLYNYGVEKAIYVSNNDFGPNAYFEFYGMKNTIGLDSLLYNDWQKDLFNPEYSLVSDTNAYFLTLAPESSNKRYTLVQPNYSNITLTPFSYYLHEEKIIFTNAYFKNVVSDVRYSNFEPSEGFGTSPAQTSNTILNLSQFVNNSIKPKLEFRTGTNGLQAQLEIWWNNKLLDTKEVLPKATRLFSYTLEPDEVVSSNTLSLKNTYSNNDRHRLAYVSLVYPRAFDFGNKDIYFFTMPASASAPRLLEINNVKSNNQNVYLYDIENNIRYTTQVNDSKVKVQINPSPVPVKYVLLSESAVRKVPNLVEFTPKSFDNKGQEYIIITNQTLFNSGPNYVKDYADYRSSSTGGGYNTEVVEIQDIYDNFGYGIDRHFMGIKQFAGYMHQNWDKAKFVFIIGKGLEYNSIRTTNDIINNTDKTFFIPTFGYPGSDNMLFSEGNYPDPYFAVGRLAARTSEDIRNYLDKVRQYDDAPNKPQTIEDKYWMKKAMHLGGGVTQSEKDSFKGILKTMENIISKSKLGLSVNSYYKSSTDVLESVTTDRIRDEINNGLSIITFFGHSAAGTWEFSLENPRDYNNTGKYPFINSLGCYSGNIFGTSSGISEFFVLEKDKGSIAFLASTSTAYSFDLSNFGNKQYEEIGNTSYNEPIGLILRKISNSNRYSSTAKLAFYQQMTFHGDPAIKIYSPEGPDYLFNFKATSTSPDFINSSTETFDVHFEIVNIGKATNDSIDVRLFHQLPDLSFKDTVIIRVPAPFYSSQHTVTFKNYGIDAIGKNKIYGEIDYDNKLIELPMNDAELNNILKDDNKIGYEFYILDETAFPIYPANFGILTDSKLSLKSSTSNAFLEKRRYVIQLDTTENFNSPMKIEEVLLSSGGLIEWLPKINYTPNTVYYWRIRPDSLLLANNIWQNSSFIYRPGDFEGWNHSHYYQYKYNNKFNQISINDNRKFEFPYKERTLRVVNGIYVPGQIGYGVNLDDFAGSIRPWTFATDGAIGVAIASPETGLHIGNSGGQYGSISTTATGGNYCFAFNTKTPEQRYNLMNFLENHIPDGYYTSIFTVLTSTSNDLKTQDWAADSLIYGKNLFSVLEKLGSTKSRLLEQNGSVPYNFMLVYNKEVKAESCANSKDEIIQTRMYIPLQQNEGVLKTIEVGPASKWHRFEYNITNAETSDTILVNIVGIDDNQNESILFSRSQLKNISLEDISSDSFPYLRIEIEQKDIINKTPANIEFLRVYYDGFHEIAIDPNKFFTISNDSLDQGDLFKVGFCVTNLTKTPTDSIDLKLTIINRSDNVQNIYEKSLRKMNASDTLQVNYQKVFLDRGGEYNFIAEVNHNKRFKENHYFNNIGKKTFWVKKDFSNPLLDVYFDGQKILDGDIVSSKPEILITLKDDNTFLSLTDPELFEIKLDTGRFQYLEIPMSSPQIKFTPANQNDQTAKVHFYPTLKEGEYRLLVQGKDASGNKSGVNPISISFRVIEKQSISNVLNYPNPFSTSTQFVFTLTGDEVPDILSISIMTLTGKVVKEITKEELGPLRIGINRTEYKWDGTDEYGSKLANGVYLYKVNSRKQNGEKYDQYKLNKIDNLYKDGFGKLVILR